MRYLLTKSIIAVFCLVLIPNFTMAFDDKSTHPKLTYEAVNNSGLNNYLNNLLDLFSGDDTILVDFTGAQNTSINDWLVIGSELEDTPLCRASNHFHNPVAGTWEEGKLTDEVWFFELKCNNSEYYTKHSNLIWATGQNEFGPLISPPNNNLSSNENGRNWNVARNLFYISLTSDNPDIKEGYLAETFKTLGYVIHLLEDTAVPAHTRNDSSGHLKFKGIGIPPAYKPIKWWVNPFENYVKGNWDSIQQAIASDVNIPNSISFTGEATLANFWDTDDYDPGVAPPTNSTDIGLSEYSNGNFVSYSTIFPKPLDQIHNFSHPSTSSINELDGTLKDIVAKDGKTEKVLYIEKIGEGEAIEHFLTVRYLSGYMWGVGSVPLGDSRAYKLDYVCFKDYAKLLIPRAIGYSSELINYFFRGILELTSIQVDSNLPIVSIYNYVTFSQGFDQLTINVRNATLDADDGSGNPLYPNEEILNGELVAVATYIIDGVEDYSVSSVEPIASLSASTGQQFIFDFSGDPIPPGVSELSVQVVFQGTLGNEQDIAVAVGREQLIYGPMDVTPPTEYVYSIIDAADPDFYDVGGNPLPQYFDTVKASLLNMVVGKDMVSGTLTAVAAYKNRTNYQPDLSTDPPTSADRESFFTYSISNSVNILTLPTINTTPTDVVFNFAAEPIPAGITDLYLYIVFEGTLNDGQTDEPDAIVVGIKDLNEPQHFSFWNNTDYFLLNGYPELADDIRNDPNVNNYGYIEPHKLIEAVAFTDNMLATGLPALINMALDPGQYSKFVILTDAANNFYIADYVDDPENNNTEMPDEGITYYPNFSFSVVENQLQNDGLWENTQIITSRAVRQHSNTYFVNFYPTLELLGGFPAPNNDLKPVSASQIYFPPYFPPQ